MYIVVNLGGKGVLKYYFSERIFAAPGRFKVSVHFILMNKCDIARSHSIIIGSVIAPFTSHCQNTRSYFNPIYTIPIIIEIISRVNVEI